MQRITTGIGQMNIGESAEFYNFRISLPGVAGNDGTFRCQLDPSGLVEIQGVTSTGEQVVERPPQVFYMESQNLCPPGPFSLKFSLPGPVSPESFRSSFADGMFEGIVRKFH
ncbi:Alpha-crystallin domain-containing protein 22.3 [Linum grandiflorum]